MVEKTIFELYEQAWETHDLAMIKAATVIILKCGLAKEFEAYLDAQYEKEVKYEEI